MVDLQSGPKVHPQISSTRNQKSKTKRLSLRKRSDLKSRKMRLRLRKRLPSGWKRKQLVSKSYPRVMKGLAVDQDPWSEERAERRVWPINLRFMVIFSIHCGLDDLVNICFVAGIASPNKRPTLFDVFRRKGSDGKREKETVKIVASDRDSNSSAGSGGIMNSVKQVIMSGKSSEAPEQASKKAVKDGSAHPHAGSDARVMRLKLMKSLTTLNLKSVCSIIIQSQLEGEPMWPDHQCSKLWTYSDIARTQLSQKLTNAKR